MKNHIFYSLIAGITLMFNKIKIAYTKNLFTPSIFSMLFNPFYITRKGLYEGIKKNSMYLNGRLLDFGCGSKPYADLFNVHEYIGLDIENGSHDHSNENINIFYDGNVIPFASSYFDSIFSSQVLEHVIDIDISLSELNRVMKHGGYLLVTIPFIWDEHETPYDFRRYTSFGVVKLIESFGFEVISLSKTSGYFSTLLQMLNAYIYQYIFPENSKLRLFLTIVIIFPITLLGLLLEKILPKGDTLFLDNVILAKKINEYRL